MVALSQRHLIVELARQFPAVANATAPGWGGGGWAHTFRCASQRRGDLRHEGAVSGASGVGVRWRWASAVAAEGEGGTLAARGIG